VSSAAGQAAYGRKRPELRLRPHAERCLHAMMNELEFKVAMNDCELRVTMKT
jgi:hypothetical protein